MENKRILIVDDDLSLTRLIQARLSNRDHYDVYTASSGAEAIQLAPAVMPNLILLDWVMPGMPGIDVLRKLKQIKKLQHTTIFMLTARNLVGELEQAFAFGAEGYLIKPVRLELLSAKVRDALAKSDGAPQRGTSLFSKLKELI